MADGVQPKMVFLGFGKFARADKIYALEPIRGKERGAGQRTRVWIEGVAEPVIASRTERTILLDMGQRDALSTPILDEAVKLARRVSEDSERVGPLLSRSIKAEAGRRLRRARPPRAAAPRGDRGRGRARPPLRRRVTAERLGPEFFARSVHDVAPELIGATLLVDGVGGPIVEVEAYDREDPGQPRLPRADAAQPLDVRPARDRVRLPLLRDPLVPEPRLRGRRARRPPCSSEPSSPSTGSTGCASGAASTTPRAPLRGPGPALPGARDHGRARRPVARRAALRARAAPRRHGRRRSAARASASVEPPSSRGATGSPARASSAAPYDQPDRHARHGRGLGPRPLAQHDADRALRPARRPGS